MLIFKPPKSLAACADLLYETRAERLALQKQAEELAKQEAALKDYLIERLPAQQASGISGKLAHACVVSDTIPIYDGDAGKEALWAHIRKTGQIELVQGLRLSLPAIRERWEAGKEVPGVTRMQKHDISITKV